MRNDLDEKWVIVGTDEAAGERRGAVEADAHTLGTAEDLCDKTKWIDVIIMTILLRHNIILVLSKWDWTVSASWKNM